MREEYKLYENIFNSNKYLCHYTSFVNLCSILSTMTLRVGSLSRSNDIWELESNITCITDDHKEQEVERFLETHCGYISFSTNKRRHAKNTNPKYGFSIPNMWGIYADKSKGACLIIDEKKFVQENKEILSHSSWYKFINIRYKKFQNQTIIIFNLLIPQSILEN